MKLHNIILNNLRRRKAKMLFVLLGLIIGIATVVSVYGVVETMKIEMTRQVTEFGVNVVITPDAGGLTFSYGGITLPEIMYDVEQLTTEDVSKIEALPSSDMIRIIAPKLLGFNSLETGQRIMVVGANLQEEFLIKPWLRIDDGMEMSDSQALEISPLQGEDKKMDFELIDLSRQDLERLTISNEQIIVGAVIADSLNIKEGDFLVISDKEFEISAILLESGSTEDQQIFMNLVAAGELLGRPEEITVIEMAVDYFKGSEEALLLELERELPHTYVTSLRQETLRRDEMLMRLVRFGMSISLLVLLVGMLVVGLTMLSSVRERTNEIGVFRAIGFRKSDIAKMIVLEGVIISTVGGIIGYFIGMFIASYAGPYLAGMDIQIPWRLDILLLAVGLAIVIGLVSSLYPARKAANLDPVEALRFI